MLTRQVLSSKGVQYIAQRNLGSCTVLMQKVADPIQQLFVDKIKEYSSKKA